MQAERRLLSCYPIPNKPKADLICQAFAEGVNRVSGAGAAAVERAGPRLAEGAAFFYGVRPSVAHLWSQAKADGRDYLYADNGYFPAAGRYFRIARNAVQAAQCRPDPARLAKLGVRLAKWRQSGRHVLVCVQSDEFMATVAGFTGDIKALVQGQTDRPIRVRQKGASVPLAADLVDCHCVVTWASNAAVEAICAGVPGIVLGQSATAPVAGTRLTEIEAPPMPDGREEWAARLAASQWDLQEIRSGKAWADLHGQRHAEV